MAFHRDAAPQQQRDAFWDNAKGFLELLVVLFHVDLQRFLFDMPGLSADGWTGRLFLNVTSLSFLFMVPAFFFISGFLSSANTGRKHWVGILRLLAVFAIFRLIPVVFGFFMCGFHEFWLPTSWVPMLDRWMCPAPVATTTRSPLAGFLPFPLATFAVGPEWYIWALAVHRCWMPILSQLRFPLMVSLILAMLTMVTDLSTNELSRSPFGFLPFFVFGQVAKARAKQFGRLRESLAARCAFAGAVMAVLALPPAVVWRLIRPNMGCLYGGHLSAMFSMDMVSHATFADFAAATDYAKVLPAEHCQTSTGFFEVAVFYFFSMAFILGFFTVVPSRPLTLVTTAGRKSLYVYLAHFHLMTLLCISYHGLGGGAFSLESPVFQACAAYAFHFGVPVVFWAGCARPAFVRLVRVLIEPRIEETALALVRRDEEDGASKVGLLAAAAAPGGASGDAAGSVHG